MGNVLFELKRYEEALAAHTKAIALAPSYAEAYSNMGNVLFELKRYEEAADIFTKALHLNSDFPNLLGRLVLSKLHICDWFELDDLTKLISDKILLSKNIAVPFDLLPILYNPDLIKRSTIIWSQSKYPDNLCYPKSPKIKQKKIRVGYFSSDFYNHATTHLMAEFFELHNKDNFELLAFSFGPDIEDQSRERLKLAFDQFIDISKMSDEAAIELARNLELDIAIDLKGHTQHARTKLFSRGLAPIQVGYLGYPGTIGAPFLDYIIADPILIPEASKDFYTEKIIYLPNSYQVNDAGRPISDHTPKKSEVGLPETGFVFCCFNSNYKITPSIFDSWSRILNSIEGSVLWLMDCNTTAKENLLQEAESRGVSRNRLVFAEHLKPADHLARHRLADLFIDTSPCNAHTTASDALLAGLPVLTLLGETFAGRVAASLLNAVGLPELIAKDQIEYESMAIKLATNSSQLKALRGRLEVNRLNSPLFDTQLTTRYIESAYSKIHDRHLSNLAPEHIYVPK
jgi:predicted O-linked N-acetylglucosamine transferase (SPINDLY family)